MSTINRFFYLFLGLFRARFHILLFFMTLFSCKSNSQSIIKIDFSKQTGRGSPLMFGGNNYGFTTQSISDAHKNAGFNAARYDALINDIVPLSSIADYKANVNNIQNSSTWKWEKIDNDLNMLFASKFKVLLIIDYCPVWLTNKRQQSKNNINSVPDDWGVYEDIVKKVFTHVQNKVYAVEIWNEPDMGLNIDDSPYSTKIAAYLDLYYHTAKAIRAVNMKIMIGGPAAGNTYDFSFLNALLNDPRLKKNFNFYSYHFYGVQKPGNISLIKKIAASKGRPGFPVFISEWNYSAAFNKDPMNTNSPDAISFVGNTIVNQYKEGPGLSILYCMDDYKKADNFYTMDANEQMVPKVKAITLMSVKLGLGAGPSRLYKTSASDDVNAMCALNSQQKTVVCVVNQTNVQKMVAVKLEHSKFTGTKTCEIYRAVPGKNVDATITKQVINFKNGNASIAGLALPPDSVEGLLIY